MLQSWHVLFLTSSVSTRKAVLSKMEQRHFDALKHNMYLAYTCKEKKQAGLVTMNGCFTFYNTIFDFSLILRVLTSAQHFQKPMLADLPNYPRLTESFG